MAQAECKRCRGTGWANAARDSGTENLPAMLRPIGVYRCETCNGTGKLGISDDHLAEIENAVKRQKATVPENLDTSVESASVEQLVGRVEAAKQMAAKLWNMSECREPATTVTLSAVASLLYELAEEHEKLIRTLEVIKNAPGGGSGGLGEIR